MKKQYRLTFLCCLAACFTLLFPGGAKALTREEKCTTCYEIFVWSFYDSDGDGIGDLKGVTEKLDYINDGDDLAGEDLECGMIWLMPVFPSPTYHKYDVTDYRAVDPAYGTMEDMEELIEECHKRGVRIILDLPLNHTSSEHPWFRGAAAYLEQLPEGSEPSAEACPYIDYYCFSREPGTGWEELAGTGWYYEAQFWGGMPDLNLDNEEVRGEISDTVDFWLDKGVDGFRLDAVTSYYTEDKQSSIGFVRWLNDHVKAVNPDAYLVGEAWTDADGYADYYDSGIDSMFDFAFAGQEGVIASLARGNKGAEWYGKKLTQEEQLFASHNAEAVNAPFYTNHDMSRGAGYYTKNSECRIKMALALNLLMPGNAFLYYGEELGMKGSGKDENKRAPMYWDSDPDQAGMCAGPPDMDAVEMKYGSLREQSQDPASIYSFVREVIHLRNSLPVIGCGTTEWLEEASDQNICVIIRRAEGMDPVMLAWNLSAEEQNLELPSVEGETFTELAGSLCADEGDLVLSGEKLTLPPFSVGVLKGK